MKNSRVGGLEDRQVKYLGPVHEGKQHDKKIGDEEGARLPGGAEIYRDSAFRGTTCSVPRSTSPEAAAWS